MIRTITVTNHVGDTLMMELTNPYASGFLITNVTGLGPMKASINTTELATMDGARYNSSRASQRNIVFYLEFLAGSKTIEEVRLDSYRYFPVKREVRISVETDTRIAEVTGYVESNEPDIFSEKEGCQISIMCPDPYFYKFGLNRAIITGVEPAFEFPFENNSVTEKLINFGEIRTKRDAVIMNDGDETVGVIINVHAKNDIRNFTISNVTMGHSMRIDDDRLQALIGSMISSGDDIIIDTTRGRKSILLRRRGRRINILNTLKRPLTWLQLQRGENVFYYDAEIGRDEIECSIDYQVVYEGM